MAWLALTLLFFAQAGLQPGSGIVTGLIKTTDGHPAAGIRVAAVPIDDPDGNTLLSLNVTDSAGRFKLSNIPQGSYYIVAGRLTQFTYYPRGNDSATAQKVVVEPARIVSSINFSVPAVPPPSTTASNLNSRHQDEVIAWVMIDGESNLDRRLKLLQKFQNDYPYSSLLNDLFPKLMEIYIAKEKGVAVAYNQRVLQASSDNVKSLVAQSRTLAQSDLPKAILAGEQATRAAEALKGRHPPPAYDGPAFNSWVESIDLDARSNLASLKQRAEQHP